MLTDGKQIAAARQLLGWSQTDLATHSGVSKPSIVRIESDLHSVKYEIQENIRSAIEDNGVEFLQSNGVQESRQDIKKYNGKDGFRRFYDDLYSVASTKGGEISLFNGVSELVKKWLGEDYLQIQIERMLQIKTAFAFKVVVKEGDDAFLGAKYCTYKWFPKNLFNDKTIYIYGTKVAFITFKKDDVEVMVIDQQELAECQRLFFNLAWDYIAKDTKNYD